MSDYLGKFFARLMPVLLMLVMVVVIGRYFFGIGRVDLQELALYLHALIFLGCAGWAYSEDEHVRVDIFYRNASKNYKKFVNAFGVIFFLLPMNGVLIYYSIDFILISWKINEFSTEPGGLSIVYIQKSLILLFPIVLGLASSTFLGHYLPRSIPILILLLGVFVATRFYFVGKVNMHEFILYIYSSIFLFCAGWAYFSKEWAK